MPRPTRLSLLTPCLLLLCACASLPPGKRDARDPWERMNRATYKFNDKFDKAIARPVARGYRRAVPHFAQTGIRNFFDNVDTPVVMVNDLLQGQFTPFMNDTARLLVNSTIGIGGLFDPATKMGLEKNDRDFGQTLGKWGVKKGPYVVVPFLGPSDVRDVFGKAADTYSTPRTYLHNTYWRYGLWLTEKIDGRARLLDSDRLLDSAYDPYAFLRNAYLQHRDFKVSGDRTHSSEEEQERKLMEEMNQDESAPDSSAPPAPQSPPGAPPQAQPQPPPRP
jgi:phospholipid-binding lipoprotein MlaA